MHAQMLSIGRKDEEMVKSARGATRDGKRFGQIRIRNARESESSYSQDNKDESEALKPEDGAAEV